MATSQRDKVERFRALHHRPGTFVIPNPWDAGSARVLAALGFEALATTSSGFANSLGRVDGQVTRDEALAHCRLLCAATDLPVSADLERGFADDPRGVAETIRLAAAAGLAGGSIEDYTGNPAKPIYELPLAIERIQAAAEAARSLDTPFVLTARAENLLRGVRDLEGTIERLQAYGRAGAEVLFAPGLSNLDEVRRVTSAVDKPVNVLATLIKNVTVEDLAAAGAKRISVGGALARKAMTALIEAATELRHQGTFGWMAGMAAPADVAKLLTGAGR